MTSRSRSGYFWRRLDTQYGQIKDLQVPKLRGRHQEREGRFYNAINEA